MMSINITKFTSENLWHFTIETNQPTLQRWNSSYIDLHCELCVCVCYKIKEILYVIVMLINKNRLCPHSNRNSWGFFLGAIENWWSLQSIFLLRMFNTFPYDNRLFDTILCILRVFIYKLRLLLLLLLF